MSCPRRSAILSMVSDQLSAGEAEKLRAHIDHCTQCRAYLGEAREVHRQLAAWQPEWGNLDLAERVVQAARANRRPQSRIFRMAAAASVAAGLGLAAGLLVPAQTFVTRPQNDVPVGADEVAVLLGIAELGTDSATGLSAEVADIESGGLDHEP